MKMVSQNDKETLIKEYESRIHPCVFAAKSISFGYPALYWFCSIYRPYQNALCCMGGDQELVEITAKKCEIRKEEQAKFVQQKQDLDDLQGDW